MVTSGERIFHQHRSTFRSSEKSLFSSSDFHPLSWRQTKDDSFGTIDVHTLQQVVDESFFFSFPVNPHDKQKITVFGASRSG